MSETCEQMTFWPDADGLTSSWAASRASRQVSLANDWDLPTLDGSGPNTSDSSWRFALAGYLLRMCQGFYRSQNPNGSSLIWNRRVTKFNRMLPVLGRSGRRTKGIESGSSDADLESARRTPCNRDHHPNVSEGTAYRADRSLMLSTQARWPTPQAGNEKWTGGPLEVGGAAARKIMREALGLPCAGPPAPAKPSMSGKRLVSSGQLNPAWVTQLQGLPDGWLDLPDATLSRLLATRTRHTSPTSSVSG